MIWNLRNPAEWLIRALGGTVGTPVVNSESILGAPAVWYAVQKIAGDVGKMPLEPRLYRENGSNEVFRASPTYRILRDEFNKYQTADVGKEQIQAHALNWGNGRAYIVREAGQPKELLPLRPDATETVMINGEKWHLTQPDADDPVYFYQELRESLERRELSNKLFAIPDRDVLHIMGFSTYGVVGKSIAEQFREVFGTELAAQKYNKDQLNNGMAARLMLEAPDGTFADEEEAQSFLKGFRENYERKQKGHVAGLLRDGIKAVDVSRMSNVDAQYIEQRKFTRQDVMLIFGLPHIPGDETATSYNSLENQQLHYLSSCFDRWLTRWEMQCDMKLRTEAEKRAGSVFFKFNRRTWLQTDTQATAAVLNSYVASKIMSRNEARDKLDMNPVEGGDVFENPNITTQNVTEIVNATASHIAASVLFDRFKQTECDRVSAAINNKNFVDWIERNYNTWEQTYQRQAAQIGVDHEPFVQELMDRKQQLLEACECQPDELAARVQAVVKTWSSSNDNGG